MDATRANWSLYLTRNLRMQLWDQFIARKCVKEIQNKPHNSLSITLLKPRHTVRAIIRTVLWLTTTARNSYHQSHSTHKLSKMVPARPTVARTISGSNSTQVAPITCSTSLSTIAPSLMNNSNFSTTVSKCIVSCELLSKAQLEL